MPSPVIVSNEHSILEIISGFDLQKSEKYSFLIKLYDENASKILGFIRRQSFTPFDSEKLLMTVFLKAWGNITWLSENQDNNFKNLLHLTGKILRDENPQLKFTGYNK